MAWLPWTLCLLLASSTIYFALGSSNQTAGKTDEEDHTSASGQAGQGSAFGGLPKAQIALESRGYVIPVHQIQVSPKVSGMVIELNIEEGKYVKKGQVLARLETVDYEADYDHAVATTKAAWQRWKKLERGYREEEKQQAENEWKENQAQEEMLRLDWIRTAELQKKGQVLAPKEIEQAFSAYESQKRKVMRMKLAFELMKMGPRDEEIKAAEGDYLTARADEAKAKWRLDNCIIVAPVSGTILTKKAEEGNIVNPIAFNVSASLCDMADLSDLEIDLAIPERDISRVFKGQRCEVRPEAFPERRYEGYVSRLMPTADRSKGAIPVRVKVMVPAGEADGRYLKPDMGAAVTFLNSTWQPPTPPEQNQQVQRASQLILAPTMGLGGLSNVVKAP
jgi:multidrug resistance efflux pump